MTHFQVCMDSRCYRIVDGIRLESPSTIQSTLEQCIGNIPLGIDFFNVPQRYQGLSSAPLVL